jgi:ankyrin repeat protein
MACRHADTTAAQILLDYGARFDPMAVFEAIRGDESKEEEASTATLGFIINLGAQIEDVVAWRKGTLLRYAVTLEKIDHLKMLLENGADPGATWGREQTVVEYARLEGKAEIIELLEEAMLAAPRRSRRIADRRVEVLRPDVDYSYTIDSRCVAKL